MKCAHDVAKFLESFRKMGVPKMLADEFVELHASGGCMAQPPSDLMSRIMKACVRVEMKPRSKKSLWQRFLGLFWRKM